MIITITLLTPRRYILILSRNRTRLALCVTLTDTDQVLSTMHIIIYTHIYMCILHKMFENVTAREALDFSREP